nr:helix-turn-helix domain containing protein [Aestuariicella hydrocarbonica]
MAEREQSFLDQAWAMIQADGVLNLQMARLASACEYSVGTLYQHFSSKEDLLVALATRSVGERLELYQRASQWQAPSRHRMLAILLADVLIAQKAPEYFRLAQYVSTHTIWMAASGPRREAALEASQPLGAAVENIVKDAVQSGDVRLYGLSARELSAGLWAMCEGMHSLVSAAGLLEAHSVPRPFQLLMASANAWLNGQQWRPEVALDDVAQQNAVLLQIMDEVFVDFPKTACPVVALKDSD